MGTKVSLRQIKKMLQLQVLRQDAEEVKKRLEKKNFYAPQMVDEIIDLDDERKNYNWIQTIHWQRSMQLPKRSVS